MSDFMNFVLSHLQQALLVAVFAAAVGIVVLFLAARRHKQNYGEEVPFPWLRSILVLLLIAYLAVVMLVTVRGRGYYTGSGNFHLFRAWREAWNSFSERSWLNVLLNIALFVPLGFFLPLIWKRLRSWYLLLPIGFLSSLLIEVSQYLTGSGLFDVDDLFTNTLGAMIGFWAVMMALSLWGRCWGKASCHALALVAVAAAIGGIFAAYDLQEYGNLATSPAFWVDTKDVQWTVSCELPDTAQTVDIYQTQVWTKESCEAFGREFFKKLGVEQVDVTIYNEEVYLREYHGNRILEVFYQGGYYSYNDLYMNQTYAEAGAQQVRQALLEYGIEVPETAEYTYETDTHFFRVKGHVEENRMTDGTVAVQWEDGFGIRSIDNNLLQLTYYGQEKIISPKAAVQTLMDGHISGGDWFEKKEPRQVQIMSCDLAYQVDTKGFYQPVYRIRLFDAETGYDSLQIVPAIP